MLGYDWPRLHAALNDLPAALLLVAVLFDLRRRWHPPARASGSAGFWTLMAGAVGGGARGRSPGCRRRSTSPTARRCTEVMETHERAGARSRWASSRCWRSGGSCGSSGWAAPSGRWRWRLARRARASSSRPAVYGGKLVFEHAAGIPTEVLQAEMHERAEGHHHHGGEGESESTSTARSRRADAAATPTPSRDADSGTPAATPMRPARRRTRTDAMRAPSLASVWLAAGARGAASRRPPGRRFRRCREAAITEVRLPAREATRLLAEALQADSIPGPGGELRDGWLETGWFDAATGRRTGRRPIGPAWCASAPGPTRPVRATASHVETIYRPLADPSLPERELDAGARAITRWRSRCARRCRSW